MALSTAQVRWGRLLLVFLGAFALAFRFWPIPLAHYAMPHSQQAWDDLAAVEGETLGVSAYLTRINAVRVSHICSLG